MSQAIANDVWTGEHFIGGEWQAAVGERFESFNPARADEVVGHYPRGTAADVDAAVNAARTAYDPWRRTSRVKRGELFLKLAELIEREVDALARVLARESGKVLDEARAEVVEGLHMVQYVFGTARQPSGQVIDS